MAVASPPTTVARIPAYEFRDRNLRLQRSLQDSRFDALLVHSNEADFANVRYLSDYWPLFESAAVLIQADGDPILLIGPESETYARDHSAIGDIRKILYYRECAEPDYPDIAMDTFEGLFSEANNGLGIQCLGIVGATAMPVSVYEAVKAALRPGSTISRADEIMHQMRAIKSPNEIACLKEAFRICELMMDDVLAEIRPGMTELQVVGIAQRAIYEHGGEYEAHPTYVLSGINSTHAIGRPGHRVIQRGEIIQLNMGARVSGYSPSIGIPICIGKMDARVRDLVSFGLEAHDKTMSWMKAGIPAKDVVNNFTDYVTRRGYGDNLLYGPCHGLGMMEVERPWMESSSEYLLEENMTFQVDTFLHCPEYGLRWETGVRITSDGVERLSRRLNEIVEID